MIKTKPMKSALIALVCSMASAAYAEPTQRIDVPAGDIVAALESLAKQADIELVFQAEELKGIHTDGVKGIFAPHEAVAVLLKGTSLKMHTDSSGAMFISTAAAETVSGTTSSISSTAALGGKAEKALLLAKSDTIQNAESQSTTQSPEIQRSNPDSSSAEESGDSLEEIIVTGSHIRGVADQFSPTYSISRNEMDLAGQRNVSEVLQAIPQNFGGGVTPDTTVAGSASGVGSAGVNLRGLGNEATLVLLNGRRMAGAGLNGNFVDISSIPTSAVDRVEVVTDGASAIYGSDAIAGVVNIILREDFQGAETRVGLGTTSASDNDSVRLGQTFGWSGARAHALLTYEHSREDEIDASDRGFSANAPEPTYLLPETRTDSLFATGGIQLAERYRISADAYYNERDTSGLTATDVFSPLQISQDVDIQQYGAGASLVVDLTSGWKADFTGAHSFNHYTSQQQTVALPDLMDDTETEITSVDASIGGPLLSVSDEAVRFVLGTHYRTESANILSVDPGTGVASTDLDRSREVFASFTEIYAPLVTESDAVPGVERLAFSLAARYEQYSDAGHSFDPKASVAWTPFSGVNLRGTYGTSFRVARLDQLTDEIVVALLGVFDDPSSPTGQSVALDVSGQTSDLDPEQATVWTAGFDFEPEWGDRRLRVSGTYFQIDYEDRIGMPSADLDSVGLFTFNGVPERNPDPTTISTLADSAFVFFDLSTFFPGLGPLSLADVTVLLDERPQNLSSSTVEGVDLSLSYFTRSNWGDWTFFVASTFLTAFDQQFSPATPVDELLNTFGNPVDLRLRGSAQWRGDTVSAALYANHVDGYLDDEATPSAVAVRSWTTFDASLALDLGRLLGGDSQLSFNVSNLLDEPPPRIGTSLLRANFYDAANAGPVGRRFSLILRKQW